MTFVKQNNKWNQMKNIDYIAAFKSDHSIL